MARWVYVAAAVASLTIAADGAAKPRHAKPRPAAGYVLYVSSHLAEAAKVSIDGAAPVTAPGYGSTPTRITAGKHTLAVTSKEGVNYKGELTLDPANLFDFQGKRYWCVNLLETELQPYSKAECQEDVSDRG
jgi:hypothetical protein